MQQRLVTAMHTIEVPDGDRRTASETANRREIRVSLHGASLAEGVLRVNAALTAGSEWDVRCEASFALVARLLRHRK
ncbi:MAG: hypothetical protein R3F43_02155 [bacterium]